MTQSWTDFTVNNLKRILSDFDVQFTNAEVRLKADVVDLCKKYISQTPSVSLYDHYYTKNSSVKDSTPHNTIDFGESGTRRRRDSTACYALHQTEVQKTPKEEQQSNVSITTTPPKNRGSIARRKSYGSVTPSVQSDVKNESLNTPGTKNKDKHKYVSADRNEGASELNRSASRALRKSEGYSRTSKDRVKSLDIKSGVSLQNADILENHGSSTEASAAAREDFNRIRRLHESGDPIDSLSTTSRHYPPPRLVEDVDTDCNRKSNSVLEYFKRKSLMFENSNPINENVWRGNRDDNANSERDSISTPCVRDIRGEPVCWRVEKNENEHFRSPENHEALRGDEGWAGDTLHRSGSNMHGQQRVGKSTYVPRPVTKHSYSETEEEESDWESDNEGRSTKEKNPEPVCNDRHKKVPFYDSRRNKMMLLCIIVPLALIIVDRGAKAYWPKFCDSSYDEEKNKFETPSTDCVKCPNDATCRDGEFVSCSSKYTAKRHWNFSINCVKDIEGYAKALIYAKWIARYLSELEGRRICGQVESSKITKSEIVDILKNQNYIFSDQQHEEFLARIEIAFDDILPGRFVSHLTDETEIEESYSDRKGPRTSEMTSLIASVRRSPSWTSTSSNEVLWSVKATKPFTCQMSETIRNNLWRLLLTTVLLAVFLIKFYTQRTKSRIRNVVSEIIRKHTSLQDYIPRNDDKGYGPMKGYAMGLNVEEIENIIGSDVLFRDVRRFLCISKSSVYDVCEFLIRETAADIVKTSLSFTPHPFYFSRSVVQKLRSSVHQKNTAECKPIDGDGQDMSFVRQTDSAREIGISQNCMSPIVSIESGRSSQNLHETPVTGKSFMQTQQNSPFAKSNLRMVQSPMRYL